MASPWKSVGNGHLEGPTDVSDLDASKLEIRQAEVLKEVPSPESLVFGQTYTDHMLQVTFDPITGWSAPEIKPYENISLDPAASCFQYATSIFEGMKAYLGPNGEPRLFRPDKNMERLSRSAERLALPPFNPKALLKCIQRLIVLEKRWIPTLPGYSLYIRPTIIGTRRSIAVGASDHCILFVILSPAGPYFQGASSTVSLLAMGETVRSWPGGTGGHKLGLNYSPGFLPQRIAAKQGYNQILWLLDNDKKITEAGAMNVFVSVKSKESDDIIHVYTPPLDGTILPGLTRASTLALLQAHTEGKMTLPNIPSSTKFNIEERVITMSDLMSWYNDKTLMEMFGVGTAVIVAPVGRIGHEGSEIIFPNNEIGLGTVGQSLWDRITEIQTGRFEWEGWSLVCQ